MISPMSKQSFWTTVEDCLVSFHHIERLKAREMVDGLQARISTLPEDLNKDIIYHDEPFYVANGLVGKAVPLAGHKRAYDAIMRKNYASALVSTPSSS